MPEYITVSEDFRKLDVPQNELVLGCVGDAWVRRIYFTAPKFCDGTDLSGFDFTVQFVNAANESDVYEVDDVTASTDTVTFSWLVSPIACAVVGNTEVSIVVSDVDSETGDVLHRFLSTTYKWEVLPAITAEGGEAVEAQTYVEAMIAAWQADIDTMIASANNRNYDTVADMQADTTLTAGMICHTLGFHAAGDGGAAWYKIASHGVANGMDILQLDNGKVAELQITESYVTPEMFGAYGDGVHDDSIYFTKALTYGYEVICNDNKIYAVKHVCMGANDLVVLNGNSSVFDFIDTDMSNWDTSNQYTENGMFYSGSFDDASKVNENQIVRFVNCKFHFNADNFTNIPSNLKHNGFGLCFYKSKCIEFEGCFFKDSFLSAIYYCNIGELYIDNCEFEDISVSSTVPSGTSRNCVECGQNIRGASHLPTNVYSEHVRCYNVYNEYLRADTYEIVYCNDIYLECSYEGNIVENHNDGVVSENYIFVLNSTAINSAIAAGNGSGNTVYIENCHAKEITTKLNPLEAYDGSTTYIVNSVFDADIAHNALYITNNGNLYFIDSKVNYARGSSAQLIDNGNLHIINSVFAQELTNYYKLLSIEAINSSIKNAVAKNIKVINSVVQDSITQLDSGEYIEIIDSSAKGFTIATTDINCKIVNSVFGTNYTTFPATMTGVLIFHDCVCSASYSGVSTNLSNITKALIHDVLGNFGMKGTVGNNFKFHDNSFNLVAP